MDREERGCAKYVQFFNQRLLQIVDPPTWGGKKPIPVSFYVSDITQFGVIYDSTLIKFLKS